MRNAVVKSRALQVALSHDQTASRCPWLQLTRSTADYPSRKATAALALFSGLVDPEPDLIELIFRCDGCGRCQEFSDRPRCGPLSEVLFAARSALVERGFVPQVELPESSWPWTRSNSGVTGSVLFVPGAAVLQHDPASARAARRLVEICLGEVAVDRDVVDSGYVFKELGHREQYEFERKRIRGKISDGAWTNVITGTPKDAFGFAGLLDGLPVEIAYAGSLVAQAMTARRLAPRKPETDAGVVFHPSEYLLHHLNECNLIESGLRAWLGESFRPEPDAAREAWPAAIERPRVLTNPVLLQELANRRAAQLMKISNAHASIVLTVDPYSRIALAAALPPGYRVVDFLSFVEERLLEIGA